MGARCGPSPRYGARPGQYTLFAGYRVPPEPVCECPALARFGADDCPTRLGDRGLSHGGFAGVADTAPRLCGACSLAVQRV